MSPDHTKAYKVTYLNLPHPIKTTPKANLHKLQTTATLATVAPVSDVGQCGDAFRMSKQCSVAIFGVPFNTQ